MKLRFKETVLAMFFALYIVGKCSNAQQAPASPAKIIREVIHEHEVETSTERISAYGHRRAASTSVETVNPLGIHWQADSGEYRIQKKDDSEESGWKTVYEMNVLGGTSPSTTLAPTAVQVPTFTPTNPPSTKSPSIPPTTMLPTSEFPPIPEHLSIPTSIPTIAPTQNPTYNPNGSLAPTPTSSPSPTPVESLVEEALAELSEIVSTNATLAEDISFTYNATLSCASGLNVETLFTFLAEESILNDVCRLAYLGDRVYAGETGSGYALECMAAMLYLKAAKLCPAVGGLVTVSWSSTVADYRRAVSRFPEILDAVGGEAALTTDHEHDSRSLVIPALALKALLRTALTEAFGQLVTPLALAAIEAIGDCPDELLLCGIACVIPVPLFLLSSVSARRKILRGENPDFEGSFLTMIAGFAACGVCVGLADPDSSDCTANPTASPSSPADTKPPVSDLCDTPFAPNRVVGVSTGEIAPRGATMRVEIESNCPLVVTRARDGLWSVQAGPGGLVATCEENLCFNLAYWWTVECDPPAYATITARSETLYRLSASGHLGTCGSPCTKIVRNSNIIGSRRGESSASVITTCEPE